MYRNTAQLSGSHIATSTLPPPRLKKDKEESDVEVTRLLAEKRSQLEDEIARFKALKDAEFQDFERDLMRQRQKRKRETTKTKAKPSSASNSPAPNALSLLGVLDSSDCDRNSSIARQRKSKESDEAQMKPSAPPSKPTISLDKLNIKGETTPPPTSEDLPPSPTTRLMRQVSRSPTIHSLSATPPRVRSGKQQQEEIRPLAPANDRVPDNFAGIFAPAYLPLLDTRSPSQPHQKARSGSFSLPQSSSVSLSISPVSQKDRANTAPLLPSSSLPSALRTASGTAVRKRKRVTFQLADSAIVEPSSSYEEGPSPVREDELDFDEEIDVVVTNGNGETKHAGDEPQSGLAKKVVRSPTIPDRERTGSNDDEFLSPMEVAIEGDNGIGFFELDEELQSPGAGDADRKFIDEVEDADDGGVEEAPKRDEDEVDQRNTYEYGGSVPIVISRPSGSWLGSFGH